MANLCKIHPREYNSFYSMRTRCTCKAHAQYKNYGGKGVKICGRWMEPRKGFSNFLEDMGERPIGKTLDRIDNDGPYSPDNCRWATKQEQADNMGKTIKWAYNGEEHTIREWAEKTGISKIALYQRVKSYGYSIEEALTHSQARKGSQE